MFIIFIASVVQQIVEPLQYDAYINVSADATTCTHQTAVHVTDISLHLHAPPSFPSLAVHPASDRKMSGILQRTESWAGPGNGMRLDRHSVISFLANPLYSATLNSLLFSHQPSCSISPSLFPFLSPSLSFSLPPSLPQVYGGQSRLSPMGTVHRCSYHRLFHPLHPWLPHRQTDISPICKRRGSRFLQRQKSNDYDSLVLAEKSPVSPPAVIVSNISVLYDFKVPLIKTSLILILTEVTSRSIIPNMGNCNKLQKAHLSFTPNSKFYTNGFQGAPHIIY